MKAKALIVESTRLFQNVIEQVMNNNGVECHIYSNGKDALEASHNEYTFILVSRTLEDFSGEVFLHRYKLQHGLGNALTIMLTIDETKGILHEANQAGFKLVFNKKNLDALQNIIINILNTRTLSIDSKILLIEDTKSIADMIVNLFEKHRTHAIHASTLDEMKSELKEHEFELIITDYYLANNETGDEVISYIRNHADTNISSVPILVVSAESSPQKRISFLRNGAEDFILKPYDADELLVRASNLVKNYRILKKFKQQQQDLTKLALTDHLTGLYNRHSLYELGPKYISNAHRHKTALSLLVIDLDHFKKINDTHGHSVGDIVLESVASLLHDSCRTEDIAARFGGEEFIMVLTNCNKQDAINKAEKLRQMIEDSKPENLTVTSSIGVAELHEEEGFDALFNRADKAVYQAKESGRNRVVAFE